MILKLNYFPTHKAFRIPPSAYYLIAEL